MSKKRLEEISERVIVDKVYYKYLDGTKGHWSKTYTLSEEDYSYLIEQAGRVQELEDKCNYLSDMNEMLVDLNGVLPDEPELYIKLKKENKRYREALEAIYELAEYDEYDNTLEQIISEVEKVFEGHE